MIFINSLDLWSSMYVEGSKLINKRRRNIIWKSLSQKPQRYQQVRKITKKKRSRSTVQTDPTGARTK